MKAVRYLGYGWCAAVVISYVALWLTSEHGGGILSQSGWGEIWLIALACGPGVLLIKFADAKRATPPRSRETSLARPGERERRG
jgi:hypothetical protein